jgi:hypothetical protein
MELQALQAQPFAFSSAYPITSSVMDRRLVGTARRGRQL